MQWMIITGTSSMPQTLGIFKGYELVVLVNAVRSLVLCQESPSHNKNNTGAQP